MGRLSDYIDQIHRELESQASEFRSRLYAEFPQHGNSSPTLCPSCGSPLPHRRVSELNYCPFCGVYISHQTQTGEILKPLYKLPHYDEFEDDTKSKIGTFERIYQQTFQPETGRVLMEKTGFDLLDYSPLVNPLASALEIELGQSIGKVMRKEYGKDGVIHFGDKEIQLSHTLSFSLREYELCMKYDCKKRNVIKKSGFSLDEVCFKTLKKIIDVRNEASHKKYVSQERFLLFYENIYVFFETYIAQLLILKRT